MKRWDDFIVDNSPPLFMTIGAPLVIGITGAVSLATAIQFQRTGRIVKAILWLMPTTWLGIVSTIIYGGDPRLPQLHIYSTLIFVVTCLWVLPRVSLLGATKSGGMVVIGLALSVLCFSASIFGLRTMSDEVTPSPGGSYDAHIYTCSEIGSSVYYVGLKHVGLLSSTEAPQIIAESYAKPDAVRWSDSNDITLEFEAGTRVMCIEKRYKTVWVGYAFVRH